MTQTTLRTDAAVQDSDNGPVLLVTAQLPANAGGGYCGHRVLLVGPNAGVAISSTRACDTPQDAMDIMLRNPPILSARRQEGR